MATTTDTKDSKASSASSTGAAAKSDEKVNVNVNLAKTGSGAPMTELELTDADRAEIQKLAAEKTKKVLIEREAQRMADAHTTTAVNAPVDTDDPYGLKGTDKKPVFIEDGFIKDPNGEVVGKMPAGQPKTEASKPPRMELDGAHKHMRNMEGGKVKRRTDDDDE